MTTNNEPVTKKKKPRKKRIYVSLNSTMIFLLLSLTLILAALKEFGPIFGYTVVAAWTWPAVLSPMILYFAIFLFLAVYVLFVAVGRIFGIK